MGKILIFLQVETTILEPGSEIVLEGSNFPSRQRCFVWFMVTTGRIHGGLFLNLGSIEHVIHRICIDLLVIFLAGGKRGERGHYPVPGFL